MIKKLFLLTTIVFICFFGDIKSVSAQGTYSCEWTNVGCVVSLTGTNCSGGASPPINACESANSKCQVGVDASCFWCTDMKGLECQGGTKALGFKCSALTCIQCDPTTEPDGTCEFPPTQETACIDFCTNNVRKGWDWDPVNEKCIEIQNGRYLSETECLGNNAGMGIKVNFPQCRFQNGRLDTDLGIPTAFGCIPIASVNTLVVFLIKWGLRFAGGVAMLLIIIAAILLITSSGDLKKIQSAKELITATITGILMLIFSIFILRFIGANILQIVFFGG